MTGKAKGSDFEREICRSLSLWFSKGQNDDYFWRADASGARATFRHRQGKSVTNCGDIKAIDERGLSLTRLATIECKRGYSYETISDLLDKKVHPNLSWDYFFRQVIEGQKASKTPGWFLITQRNRRKTLMFMNFELYTLLDKNGASLYRSRPCQRFVTAEGLRIFGTTLENFFQHVSREAVIDSL